MTAEVEPFEIRVDDSVLEDLHDRLSRTRFPDQIGGSGWEYGIPVDYLRELVHYWLDRYDWRAEEARLNQLDHFRTTIDGQSIHFIHARSGHQDAFPLLLTHGWPGSFVEFLEVIPRLAQPEAFGGDPTDAFHVVVPSLPGYGFSGPTRSTGWDEERIARAFAELMSRLGYSRYGAQGGDWGAQVSTRIGLLDSEHCAGIHLNMPIGVQPKETGPLTDDEQADLAAMQQFVSEESGYANEQGTKPQTVGVALNDSPAGLLGMDRREVPGLERLRRAIRRIASPAISCITNVMVYWVTQTSASSARLYWESRHGARPGALPFVDVPTGVARYPKEVLRWPRSWVERQYNVVHWAVMDEAATSPAMEQPELFVDDLRRFFRAVR